MEFEIGSLVVESNKAAGRFDYKVFGLYRGELVHTIAHIMRVGLRGAMTYLIVELTLLMIELCNELSANYGKRRYYAPLCEYNVLRKYQEIGSCVGRDH